MVGIGSQVLGREVSPSISRTNHTMVCLLTDLSQSAPFLKQFVFIRGSLGKKNLKLRQKFIKLPT